MPSYFCVSVTFLDPVPAFHGRREAGQPEWPPSPLRLFQALVAAAASRYRGKQFKAYADPAMDWLQQRLPPLVVTPPYHVGVPIRVAVPNNDMDVVATAWAKRQEPKKQPSELKTLKTIRATHLVVKDDDPPTVHYLWPLADGVAEFEKQKEVLLAAARSITHLGWGIDMVAANASVIAEADADNLPGERWLPTDDPSAPGYRVPMEGTIDALVARHEAFLNRLGPDGFNPVPPLSTFRVVGYRRATDPAPRPRVVFELRNDDGSRFRYPQERLIHIAGMVRHLAIELMRASPPEEIGNPTDWVRSYVAGHRDAESTEHRQLSYLPLPSVGQAHTDPSVRRVMIAAPLGDDRFVRHLARLLSGQQLLPTERTKLDHPPTLVCVQRDNVAGFYTQPATSWASVTPVILPGHDDHKPEKTRKLIEAALQQSGIELPCDFEWSAFSHFPKSLSAHKSGRDKRPTGYIRPDHLFTQTAVHLNLRFHDGLKVPGPLAIGAGRHCGFGLFAGQDGP